MSPSTSPPVNLFHIIDEGVAILRCRGVYRQAKVYRRGEEIYAGYGGGFIRLLSMNGTSVPHVSWIEIAAKGVAVDRNKPYFQATEKRRVRVVASN